MAAWAQDAGTDASGVNVEFLEAEGIEVTYVLPKYSSKLVPLGEAVEVLVGFRNGASEPVNVTYIWGKLSNENYAQNLTAQPLGDFYGRLGQIVEPGKEGSFLYRFMPAVQLPPGPYQVALNVAYTAQDEYFSNTFFNSTVELVEQIGPIDFQLLGLIGMIIATSAAAVWAYYELATDPMIVKLGGSKLSIGKSVTPKPKALPVSKSSDHLASFLKGTPADPALAEKRENSKKGK